MATPFRSSSAQQPLPASADLVRALLEGGTDHGISDYTDDPWPGLVAASIAIDLWKLARFRLLMQRQGFALDTSRLFLDPSYAYRRLALAHSCADGELRNLALQLFEHYHDFDARRQGLSEATQAH